MQWFMYHQRNIAFYAAFSSLDYDRLALVGLARSSALPWAYAPRVFGFMPYDIVIGLGPPHQPGGALTSGLLEPVYAGAATPGADACIIVPGRRLVEAVGRLNVLFGHPSTTELTLRTR
jgi:hypothetical protein